jgi:hypothetical protein
MYRTFRHATAFDANIGSWDVRLVATMTNMFQNSGYNTSLNLCGFYWLSSSAVQLAPIDVQDISYTGDGKICHCPAGTGYQSRVVSSTQPRLEYCIPCPDGTWSGGGSQDEAVCVSCEGLDHRFYCTQGKQAACPDVLGLACHQGKVIPSFGAYLNETSNAVEPCNSGHYCPGDLAQYTCPTGTYLVGALCVGAHRGASYRGLLSGAFLEVVENRIGDSMEQELTDKDSQIGYRLRLATPPGPDDTVVVRITLERSKTMACVQKEPARVQLLTSSLTFTADNYHVEQNVTAVVTQDEHFTGPYQGSFLHSVDAGSAWGEFSFLRPISLTIQDDDPCPPGAAQHASEASNGVQTCQCLEGYYVANEDLAFCASARACTLCENGMLCGNDNTRSDTFRNQKLQNIEIKRGWYRENNTSSRVVGCPIAPVCVGKAHSGIELCNDGHTGPLCMVTR